MDIIEYFFADWSKAAIRESSLGFRRDCERGWRIQTLPMPGRALPARKAQGRPPLRVATGGMPVPVA